MPASRIFDDTPEFLDLILNSLTTGIFVTDSSYTVRFINQAYADYLGFPRESIIGRPITDFIPDSRAPHVTSTGMAEMGELRTLKSSDNERVIVVNRLPLKKDHRVLGMLSQTLFSSRQEFEAVVKRVEFLDKQVSSYARRIKSALSPRHTLASIMGESKVIQDFRDLLVKYARTELAVLVTGATGTGKELAANAIHGESPRTDGPFVSINCAAIPKELFESELFGYAAGAFSGAHKDGKVGLVELADRGTLFLDEIGDTPLPAQAKLLRVLEERTLYRVGSTQPRIVDFRLVAATNRDLKRMIQDGLFREDLFYRISPLILRMPALHERREDIPQLVSHFVRRLGDERVDITGSALEALSRYDWPGNIRELHNVVARAVGLSRAGCIDLASLPPELLGDLPGVPLKQAGDGTSGLHVSLAGREQSLILLTLQEQGWNVSRTARLLGIARATLYEKMKKYGISRDRPSPASGATDDLSRSS